MTSFYCLNTVTQIQSEKKLKKISEISEPTDTMIKS